MSNRSNKAFDFAAHEIKINKLIRQSFTSSYMSNAKWRKCFRLLNKVEPNLQVIWKFVGSSNDGIRHSLPPEVAIEGKFLTSSFWFGPCYYKEIEWLEFPNVGIPYGKEKIPGAHFNQNVDSVVKALQSIGQWHIVETGMGFKLYGHENAA